MRIEYDLLPTPIGMLAVATTDKGICAVELVHGKNYLRRPLERRFGKVELVANKKAVEDVCKQILSFFKGNLQRWDVTLDIEGSPVQEKTWEALRAIPYGQTLSYGEVARKIGYPRAARAVGSACGANPILLIIPCHRVLGATGLGGFGSGGLDIKCALLKIEQRGLKAKAA